ncbi:DEAD/DEAH box helicase family protein [Clostridium perfringens]|uniref:type I restriction endonuclease subunit R n=1 Tax=Clostridium perfringens TaxID=1502 RepID=UPI001F45268B|nr:DEAD/DEAH box helicase family protein [Clostridium perfringens]MDK0574152.1 DEAD/DEAH box helicase family protein [Clostridium perfringens]UBL01198.1 DEAD/DEAH box helicase family protein [Clostridium perfringens]
MNLDYSEKNFEEQIEEHLIYSGYEKRRIKNRDLEFFRKYAIDVEILFRFLEDTQEKALNKLKKVYKDDYKTKILDRISKELHNRGMIDCIRHGVRDYGETLKLAYNKPASSMNYTTSQLYSKNIFTVSRQVYYSNDKNNSIDMMISLNGLPIVIMELKNQFTGQNVENSKKQFREDRDPNELLFKFKERAVVFLAVDTDEIYMTTKLNKNKTFFLPFNKGNEGGAGNPPNGEEFRTAYLWEDILQKSSLIDILFRFMYIKQEEIKDCDGKVIETKETVIFPRYHQLEAVRKIEAHAKNNGAGNNYLIQHSAGSGKTNSISWLAHRLAKLHDDDDKAIFDTVIVITDRRVLDKQLQDAVYQLEHKTGMVEKINKDSTQLSNALENGTKIIITTLQKFPFILDKVKGFELGKKNYAIIIDEAHSSQTGKSATAVKEALSSKGIEKVREIDNKYENENDTEDKIRDIIEKSGKQDNISFFAFTATPKAKTIELFGQYGENGEKEAFHVYTMRQAIEEGFILDPLVNYTTYKTFYKVAKAIKDDPQVSKKQATRAIVKSLLLHPYNIAQKTEIIIEHFRQCVMHKINGRAKAMVVTSSRLQAVKYKKAFDKYIKEKGYEHINALVAFSGSVDDEGIDVTESELNGFSENELPDKFHSDEYKVLIVAEKYQTGFDEPLLYAMYVDKKLDGIKAVQTLSRLNRTCTGKDGTFVLDFVNDWEDIQKSFQPYYEVTGISGETDPNLLYDLETTIKEYQLFTDEEVNKVNETFFKGTHKSFKGAEKINGVVDEAVERFKKLESNEEKDDFKSTANKFIRLYAFILQVGPFADVELHKLYIYLTFLLKKLPKGKKSNFVLSDEVALEYYKNTKTFEGNISLLKEGKVDLDPISFGKGASTEEEKTNLSNIINKLNEKFGTNFTETDKLSIDQIKEDMINNDELKIKAKNNTVENFKFSYDDKFMDIVIGRMGQNEKFFNKLLANEEFREEIKEYLLMNVYNGLKNNYL